MKSSNDHPEKRNYDDFNEFFWSRNCLKYRYSFEDPGDMSDVEGTGMLGGPLPGESLPPVCEGMEKSPNDSRFAG